MTFKDNKFEYVLVSKNIFLNAYNGTRKYAAKLVNTNVGLQYMLKSVRC
jgi:hypothetical protein